MSGEGFVLIPTAETLERLLRQTRLSTADQITLDRKQLEGVLMLARRTKCRHGTPVDVQCVDCALADDSLARTAV